MKRQAEITKVMYSFGYESKARALNGFGDMFNLPDFEERRARLVAGLDKESTAVVNRILRRLQIILKLKEGEKVDLYTKEEQKALDDSKRLLQEKIVQLAPDLFVWNGYALPCRHFEPNVFFDGYGFRFLQTIGEIGDRAIIDAGAYIGDSALMLSPLTTGKVFAFEPMRENLNYLEKTIWLNGLDNVVPVHKALGDSEGTLTMTVGNAGACATVSNRIPGDNLKKESVDVVRLDDFVRTEGVSVGLLKTDVEGAEQMLLRGAKETIQRDKPILLISIYHNASDFLDIKPMIESWGLGYQFRIFHPPIKSISGETVLIGECASRRGRRASVKGVPELETSNRHLLRVMEKMSQTASVQREGRSDLESQTASLLQMRGARDEAQKKVVEMRVARDEAQKKVVAMREARDGAQAQLAQMREGRDGALAELAKMRVARDEAQRKVVAMREARDGAQAQLARMREGRDGALAELAKMRAARDEAQKKVVAMREARDGAQAQLAQMREGRDGALAELAKMRDARDEAQKKVVAMREARDEAQKKVVAMREARDEALKKAKKSDATSADLKNVNQKLCVRVRRLENLERQLNAVLNKEVK